MRESCTAATLYFSSPTIYYILYAGYCQKANYPKYAHTLKKYTRKHHQCASEQELQ